MTRNYLITRYLSLYLLYPPPLSHNQIPAIKTWCGRPQTFAWNAKHYFRPHRHVASSLTTRSTAIYISSIQWYTVCNHFIMDSHIGHLIRTRLSGGTIYIYIYYKCAKNINAKDPLPSGMNIYIYICIWNISECWRRIHIALYYYTVIALLRCVFLCVFKWHVNTARLNYLWATTTRQAKNERG